MNKEKAKIRSSTVVVYWILGKRMGSKEVEDDCRLSMFARTLTLATLTTSNVHESPHNRPQVRPRVPWYGMVGACIVRFERSVKL